jgi:hypothetical protein
MKAETIEILQNALRAESRSFLQYVIDAYPWTMPAELAALAKLRTLILDEREGTAQIAQFLADHRQPLPYIGAYPMSFTTMNFVTLEHLLPILVKEEARALSQREEERGRVADADAQNLLRGIVDMKRRHIQVLQELRAAYPETPSSVRSSA